MRPGHEVAFLTTRLGFIRIALRHGCAVFECHVQLSHDISMHLMETTRHVCSAPLVPAFAFGQSDLYTYFRPGPPLMPSNAVAAVSRTIGFVPILFWGWCGTTIPYDVAMTVVLGDPIPTADDQTDNPSDELCKEYNKRFIENLQIAFEEHKAEAGYPDLELHVM